MAGPSTTYILVKNKKCYPDFFGVPRRGHPHAPLLPTYRGRPRSVTFFLHFPSLSGDHRSCPTRPARASTDYLPETGRKPDMDFGRRPLLNTYRKRTRSVTRFSRDPIPTGFPPSSRPSDSVYKIIRVRPVPDCSLTYSPMLAPTSVRYGTGPGGGPQALRYSYCGKGCQKAVPYNAIRSVPARVWGTLRAQERGGGLRRMVSR